MGWVNYGEARACVLFLPGEDDRTFCIPCLVDCDALVNPSYNNIEYDSLGHI